MSVLVSAKFRGLVSPDELAPQREKAGSLGIWMYNSLQYTHIGRELVPSDAHCPKMRGYLRAQKGLVRRSVTRLTLPHLPGLQLQKSDMVDTQAEPLTPSLYPDSLESLRIAFAPRSDHREAPACSTTPRPRTSSTCVNKKADRFRLSPLNRY
jgi:hypothetical protein